MIQTKNETIIQLILLLWGLFASIYFQLTCLFACSVRYWISYSCSLVILLASYDGLETTHLTIEKKKKLSRFSKPKISPISRNKILEFSLNQNGGRP